MAVALSRVVTEDDKLQRIQDNVEHALKTVDNGLSAANAAMTNLGGQLSGLQSKLPANPFIGGEVLSITFNDFEYTKVISHHLGRVPDYFVIIWIDWSDFVWHMSSNTTTITLAHSASHTVHTKIWVN